ncbi:MAG: response regulator transcription factor [Bacteroidales bacterium]|nr:response regulator transcription factor [Bacteroidales bacterium]
MEKIKILVAEDQIILRKGLIKLLIEDEDIEIAGEADDGPEAIEKAKKLQPDIVILDVNTKLNGVEVTRKLAQSHPEIKVLILTKHSSDEFVFAILDAGAKGYVIKSAAPEDLIAAIHTLYHGHSYFSPEVSKILLKHINQRESKNHKSNSLFFLTKREREILKLVAEGHSSLKIANMLFISIKTVENHRSNIMNKLKIDNLAGLIKYAIRKGIIQI